MRTKDGIRDYYDNAYANHKYDSLNRMGVKKDGSLPFYWGFMQIFRPFTGNETVLELGCGGGGILRALVKFKFYSVPLSE